MSEERNFEAEATKSGWNPDYTGENAKTAQEFVEDGEKIAGIAVKQKNKLAGEVEELQATVAALKETQATFSEHHKRTVERERKERADEVAKLESKLAEAIDAGDGQAYIQVGKQLEEVKSQPNPGDGAAVNAAWAEANPWYAKDPVLRRYATQVAAELDVNFTGSQREFMDKVSEITKKDMAHKFENPKRSDSTTEGNETKEEEPAGQNYKSLDAETKAVCDRLVAEGLVTQEQYVADYYGE